MDSAPPSSRTPLIAIGASLPPHLLPASSTMTSTPCWASKRAALSPVTPPPTTATLVIGQPPRMAPIVHERHDAAEDPRCAPARRSWTGLRGRCREALHARG